MADLSQKIENLANGPASVSGPAGSVSQQSVQSAIEADKYLASKQAAATAKASGSPLSRILGRAKVTPPSALGH